MQPERERSRKEDAEAVEEETGTELNEILDQQWNTAQEQDETRITTPSVFSMIEVDK